MIIPPIHLMPIEHKERFYTASCDIKMPEEKKTEANPSVVAVKGKYLPRNKEVYASSSTVLLLGNSPKNNENNEHLYIGLDNDMLEDIFRFKGDRAAITVGPQGDLKIPEEWIGDKAPYYLEIRKASDKKGYYVKDMTLYGTKVAPYDDYTNRPQNYPVPKSYEVLVKKDAILNLGGAYELDLGQIQKELDGLEPEKEYYIGTVGDITVPDFEDKIYPRHLKIRNLGNYYAVQDKSYFGTTITNSKYREKWNRPRPLAQWQKDLMFNQCPPEQLQDTQWFPKKS
ncbi:hypothetical protein IKQ26_02645 [bacterium]|nr:hypothetical protein [bacterium]